MKFLRHFLTAGLIAAVSLTSSASAQTSAAAYAIVDSSTGFVLESANATKKMQIASITKVATAMVVIDWASAGNEDLAQLAVVPATIGPLASPNSIGLQPGDSMSLRDLLYTSLMQSDNAAAETLAVHVGRKLSGKTGDVEARDVFVAQMNALARKNNMKTTLFLNPHGLDDLERKVPFSTAADVAVLVNYALSRSSFVFYVSQTERTVSFQRASGEPPAEVVLKNTNEVLGQDGIDGVKTGTTRKSGPCLVISAAQRPDSKLTGEKHVITPRRLTVVVLNSGSRFDTARALLTKGWQLFDQWSAAGRPMKGWKPAGTKS